MAKKSRFDGVIVKTVVDKKGYIHSYDKNDRLCWGTSEPQRVMLVNDLRKYAPGLHIGQLGWTIPGTTDGYKWIEVQFDNGPRLPILTFGVERVVPEKAEQLSKATIRENRGTRFDADSDAAASAHGEWLQKSYSRYITTDTMVKLGEGDEEVYCYTFPSLQALAVFKNESNYPVKVGYTAWQDGGALERIYLQLNEATGFPERPNVLLICRTRNGHGLETAIHARLRQLNRRIKTAPGAEWFSTNAEELVMLCQELQYSVPDRPQQPLRGNSPTLAEVVGDGEVEVSSGDGCLRIRINPADESSRDGSS